MMRTPALLIALLCGGLWWFAALVPWLASDVAQAALLITALIGGVLFLYAWVGPRLSYVQCQPTHLRVSTPLFRLAISYSRIRTTRPVNFLPAPQRWSQRRFVEPFIGRTIIALDLTGYPLGEKWLRLWLNEFMFPPNFMGLLLLTPDWMTLSRDFDTYRDQWKTRRLKASGPLAQSR